jgi:LPS export ABC transporter protein LptC
MLRPAERLTAAALLALLLGACASRQAPAAAPSPSALGSPFTGSYHIHGHGSAAAPVKVVDSVAGRPVYVLKATDVYYSTDSLRGLFENDAIYFYKGSEVRLHVAAPTAQVNMHTYDFSLSGGVDARSALGVTLTCDDMTYSGTTQLLTATGHVRAVDAQGDVLTGDKAVADLDLQQIHMTGDVGIGRR